MTAERTPPTAERADELAQESDLGTVARPGRPRAERPPHEAEHHVGVPRLSHPSGERSEP